MGTCIENRLKKLNSKSICILLISKQIQNSLNYILSRKLHTKMVNIKEAYSEYEQISRCYFISPTARKANMHGCTKKHIIFS